jgi:hypothetical protein
MWIVASTGGNEGEWWREGLEKIQEKASMGWYPET